jgi:hypothetical protein
MWDTALLPLLLLLDVMLYDECPFNRLGESVSIFPVLPLTC